MKKLMFIFTTLMFLAASTEGVLYAKGEAISSFRKDFTVGSDIKGTIIIVGRQKDALDIQQIEDMAVIEAQGLFSSMDAKNEQSDVSKVNASAGTQKVKVSWQVLDAFKAAKEIAGWTSGAFDIVEGKGDWRLLVIDEKSGWVELTKRGMRLTFAPMIEGYMTDFLIGMIESAKIENAIVKIGNMFKAVGSSQNGPWSIQVEEDTEGTAHHAMNLTMSNSAIANISSSDFKTKPLIDYRNKKQISPSLKGVSIMMNNASHAQGIAYAVFVMGPQNGMNFLTQFGKARGLIIDREGKFLKTSGL